MVDLVVGKDAAKEIQKIPLSNNVVQSRIIEMANVICNQVINELLNNDFKFAIGLDESIDVAQCA